MVGAGPDAGPEDYGPDAGPDYRPKLGLNAAQQAIIDRLGRKPSDCPTFEAGLGARLRDELQDQLGRVAEALGQSTLYVNKHTLTRVFGCEASFLHDEEQPFSWNPHIATGSVAHKAIELGINWHAPAAPALLVDNAFDSLIAADTHLADWLFGCGDLERAELRSLAVSRVTTFQEGWPPLPPEWKPTTEQRCQVELCGGSIQLNSKTDLTLGSPEGQRARKVIVDLKAGRRPATPVHLEDLRFYALLETLKLGTPPRTLVTYYLESATLDIEEVDETLLEVALHRAVDGIQRYASLLGHLGPPPEPIKRPGPPCRWCNILDECSEGQEYLDQADNDR